ncbi:MAG: MBL fold metallo-hydrolase [Anaerovoracaceae bacterium]
MYKRSYNHVITILLFCQRKQRKLLPGKKRGYSFINRCRYIREKIFKGLEETGTHLENVKGLLVTHEHIDHVKSLPVVTKKLPDIKVYANEDTWNSITRPVSEDKKAYFTTGEDFYIEDFLIRPFSIPHDAADPVGFSIYCGGRQISIVTDVGFITESIFEEIVDADLLLLEANHEKEILLMGPYPYSLKRRILGETGHLSNVSAGECLCQLMEVKQKKRRILLGHLSNENNDPSVAMLTVKNTLMEKNIFAGNDLDLEVVLRDCCSCIYEV